MRTLFTLLTFFLSAIALSAQTFFYVNALEVIPENPTTLDEVSIHVFGDYSSTGSYITGHAIEVDLYNVNLTIDCASDVGATVIVPFDTTFVIGSELPAGDYTINLAGIGLGDFVSDPLDYEFTVTGSVGLEEEVQSQVSWTWEGEELLITNEWSEAFQLTLYDVQGRQLFESQVIAPGTMRLDLPKTIGTLLLSFEANGVRWTERIVLQR